MFHILKFLLITILKKTKFGISPLLGYSSLAYLTKLLTVYYIFFSYIFHSEF